MDVSKRRQDVEHLFQNWPGRTHQVWSSTAFMEGSPCERTSPAFVTVQIDIIKDHFFSSWLAQFRKTEAGR